MNRHHCVLLLTIGCGIWGSQAVAMAQIGLAAGSVPPAASGLIRASMPVAAAAPSGPQDPSKSFPPEFDRIQTSTFITADQLAVIRDFVAKQVAKIGGNDAAAREAARDVLSAAAMINLATSADQPFLEAYAGVLNDALTPLAKNPKLHVRLNAVIVIARIGERASNARLAGAAEAFMQDKTPAVALWGMRAAKAIVPSLLAGPGGQDHPLLKVVLPVAKTHGSAEVIYEAYDLLGSAPTVSVTAEDLLALFEFRVRMYAKGLPALATAENRATYFLADSKVWPALTPAQQFRAVEQMSNLINMVAQHTMHTRPRRRAELNEAVSATAKAVWVIGSSVGDQAIQSAAEPLTRPASATPAQLVAWANTLQAAIQANQQFKATQSAPSVQPSTEPAEEESNEGADTGDGQPATEMPATEATDTQTTAPVSAAQQ